MTILYFGRVRDEVGTDKEEIKLPQGVQTLEDLITWLRQQSTGHELALGPGSMLKLAINQEYQPRTAALSQGDEVAIFPPVTGG